MHPRIGVTPPVTLLRMTHTLTSNKLREYSHEIRPTFVIDLETTGLAKDDEIVEIGVYDYTGNRTWDTLVRPTHKSADATTFITGISDEMVADAPNIVEALDLLSEVVDLKDGLFIAHNGRTFDFPRLNHVLDENGHPIIDVERTLDSCRVARILIPHGLTTTHRLETLLGFYGIDEVQDHRAGSDCRQTALVLDHLIDERNAGFVGFRSVEKMMEYSERTIPWPRADEKKARTWLKSLLELHASGELVDDSPAHRLELRYRDLVGWLYPKAGPGLLDRVTQLTRA